MGNTQSPPVDLASPRHPGFSLNNSSLFLLSPLSVVYVVSSSGINYCRAFTQKEIGDLRALFVSVATQSQSDGRYISPSVFQAYFGLKGALGERLFDLVTQQRKDQKLTFEDLPWERHSDFYGGMEFFLLQLHPKASMVRPTGTNNNLQWCAVSFSSETIPNGIGFGGQINHFGRVPLCRL
ncbi:hypothetical protein SLEP1_g19094 [Rubroshorea leprosula]|nr:hypothetical protein SLEP1_g19094 [Rubroshorea leprosula]